MGLEICIATSKIEESAHENDEKIEALVCLTPFSEEQWKFYRHEMF